ncbi:unnamed protein product [Prorocentrum cordatum]|uniref:Tyrosine-protein kinase ephrin type A/B receptor-like domain-containing protein n=1 Tax=Prorocentrum cordatum TaxID=2364126 RepID=A0ABN9PRK5_9DINO|nr:unnamed protein product [Polarella glacialis]
MCYCQFGEIVVPDRSGWAVCQLPSDCDEAPQGWADSEGRTCETYTSSALCTTSGGYGPQWDVGTFSDFASKGVSADQACCMCGGGVPPSPTPIPIDAPTPAPTPASVSVSLVVSNLNFQTLNQSSGLMVEVKNAIKAGVVKEMDGSITPDNIDVQLSPGPVYSRRLSSSDAVIADVTIVDTASAVTSAMSSLSVSDSLGSNVASSIMEVADVIGAAITGVISVADVSVSTVTSGWYDGGENQSCDQGCQALGLQCAQWDLFYNNGDVDSNAELIGIVQQLYSTSTAEDCTVSSDATAPSFGDSSCTASSPDRTASSFNCSVASSGGMHRLCYCFPIGDYTWTVQSGNCKIDGNGCLSSPNYPEWYDHFDQCTVRIGKQWTDQHRLSVEVFKTVSPSDYLEVNGVKFSGDLEDVFAELHAVVPSGDITWSANLPPAQLGWKICTSIDAVEAPQPRWNCSIEGSPCTCTHWRSDMTVAWQDGGHFNFTAVPPFVDERDPLLHWDSDGDSDLHDGHPYCDPLALTAEVPHPALCGPCDCAAGSQQGYEALSLYPSAGPQSYITCERCGVGHFSAVSASPACSPCGVGRYTDRTGATECELCPEGKYTGKSGQSACTDCAAGKYANATGMTTCESCPEGSASLGGQGFCDACSPGTYAYRPGLSECVPCLVGEFAPDNGSKSCDSCQSGKFAAQAGSSQCEACDFGRYAHDRAAVCTQCGLGMYADRLGMSECLECTVGRFAGSFGMDLCEVCSAGRFTDHIKSDACSDCEEGSFNNVNGSSGCELCQPGEFSAEEGSTSCEQCPAGTFSSNDGAEMCLSCQRGTASAEGATACDVCPEGKYTNVDEASACIECDNGTYNGEQGSDRCEWCDPGRASGRGATACGDCEEGRYANGFRSFLCTECWPGSFADEPGLDKCKACSKGQFVGVFGATACDEQCSPGTYAEFAGSASCENCTAGRYAEGVGSTACEACLPGSFGGAEGWSSCSKCPSGSFSDKMLATECTLCQLGRSAGEVGAVSCEICEAGSYSAHLGQSSCLACPSGTFSGQEASVACFDCDAGRWSHAAATACEDCDVGKFAENLKGLYLKAGFSYAGPSAFVHGQDPWHDMKMTLA